MRSGASLRALREMSLRMGAMAESILDKSLRAVWERDAALAGEVREDDLDIDRLDLEIDEAILHLFATHPPLAQDLRQALAIKGMTNDLERVGDLARNIAKSAVRLAERPAAGVGDELRALADAVERMLREALTSFADLDAELARKVLELDDRIDRQEDEIIREAIGRIREGPETAAQEIDLIYIARSLERVADHATNIAEDVIMVAEALQIKHAAKLGSGPQSV